MGIKISESKYIYDKELIRDGNYRIPASNYENASASMSPTTIASLGFCIAKLNDIIEYDSENHTYSLKQDYSGETISETTFVGAIYNAAYYNKQLLFAWYDVSTNTFTGLSNLNVCTKFENDAYRFFVKGVITLPGTYSANNWYADIALDYNEDKNAYGLSTEYLNSLYKIDNPILSVLSKYGCDLLDLFDVNNNTGELIPKTIFYEKFFDYLLSCSMLHKPYYITSNSYYDGCIVANVCNYVYILPLSYLLSFVANFDNNYNGGDLRVVWNHAVCFKIHIETNELGNHNMELVYDIDLQKVAQSIENEDVFAIEDEIPEEGLTLTDELDAKIRKAKLVYHKMFNTYYAITYAAELVDGYMEFTNTTYGLLNVSSDVIEYWYNGSYYPKKLFIRTRSDYVVTQMSNIRMALSALFNSATLIVPDSLSSRNYSYINYSDVNRVPLLLDTTEDSSYGCITANVYRKSLYDTHVYVTFICNVPNETTSELHLITIKVLNTATNGIYPIELVENINLSYSTSIIYFIPTVTESGTTVLDDDANVITNADYIKLTNIGAIYKRMLDTSSVIWFAYWNMDDGVVTQNIIQYDKSTKELKLLPSNTLSNDIIELSSEVLAGDTITDDNLNILKQADGKIINCAGNFFGCSVYGDDILLNGLTSGINFDSTPGLFSYSYLISGGIKHIDSYAGAIYLKQNENGIYLDSTGDGTKFLANDGTYKTINTAEEIPVVTLQPVDGSTAYGTAIDEYLRFTISQGDVEKLVNSPEHVYFKVVGNEDNLILTTLATKPNVSELVESITSLSYTAFSFMVIIEYSASVASAYIAETLMLPKFDDLHFYDSAGNKIALINRIQLDSSDNVILALYDLVSPVIPTLLRTIASGKSVTYTLDSIAPTDVADELSSIATFRRIDYTTDLLNIVVIKISTTEAYGIAGELISDKTYELTPKTE